MRQALQSTIASKDKGWDTVDEPSCCIAQTLSCSVMKQFRKHSMVSNMIPCASSILINLYPMLGAGC